LSANAAPQPIKINNSARLPNHRSVVDARMSVWIYAYAHHPITKQEGGKGLFRSAVQTRYALFKATGFVE
jgi:hypothetical protein